MKVHLIGSLLCAGLLVAATSDSAFAAEKQKAQPAQASNNYNNSRSNSAGIIIGQTTTNNAGQSKVNSGKPAQPQRQGRGVMAGRGGGAF
jgi:hypothetical protein